ncbi:dihydroorotase, partial [Patescibacteria group bacterium]|nr:dihydroorotase [Patescibacteria group bacterium]
RERAKKSVVNYGFHFGATTENISLIKTIKGIAGVKIYFGSSTGNLLVDDPEDIKKLFSESDKLFLIHAEDEKFIQSKIRDFKDLNDPLIHTEIRAPQAAIKAVGDILRIAEETKARVHLCHVSTRGELDLIAEAKRNGLRVTCEVSPHHLFLNSDAYHNQGNWVKMNPPLRSEEDRLALWKGIKDKTVDTIGTDHAPHTKEEKRLSYWEVPSGVPGVETMLPLLLNEVNKEKLDINRVVELVCENPAKIFRIKNKGKVEEGYDADLTLVDMQFEKKVMNEDLETKCGWTPFAGRNLVGWPVTTIVGGNIVYNSLEINEQFKGKEIDYEL